MWIIDFEFAEIVEEGDVMKKVKIHYGIFAALSSEPESAIRSIL